MGLWVAHVIKGLAAQIYDGSHLHEVGVVVACDNAGLDSPHGGGSRVLSLHFVGLVLEELGVLSSRAIRLLCQRNGSCSIGSGHGDGERWPLALQISGSHLCLLLGLTILVEHLGQLLDDLLLKSRLVLHLVLG